MSLWTSKDIANATGGVARRNWQVGGISIDSRDISKGDLFIALKAARDGHEFVKMAIDAGAQGALVSHIPKGCEDAPLVVVDDVEAALGKLGQARRNATNAKIIAVTGSAGKTSTKEMLRHVLKKFGNTHASEKSFNNHWGVPLTLARMPVDSDFAVFEIGMNAPGEIAPLVAQVRPDIALITNVAPVHLAGFENELGIAREKAAIFSALSEEGAGFVFADMEYVDFIKSTTHHALKTFGVSGDFQQLSIEIGAEHTKSQIVIDEKQLTMRINVAGAHHASNGLAVMAVMNALGLNIEKSLEAMASWLPPTGRGERFEVKIDGKNIIVVDESYNANPLSMRAALNSFVGGKAKRKFAILGDMAELGEGSKTFHEDIANWSEIQPIAGIATVGSEMLALNKKLSPDQNLGHFSSHSELLSMLTNTIQDRDHILLKASNSIGLGKTVDALRNLGQSKTINSNP